MLQLYYMNAYRRQPIVSSLFDQICSERVKAKKNKLLTNADIAAELWL